MESSKPLLTQEPPPVKAVLTEDLPLPERVRLAETATPFAGIAAGWLIDAKDTVDNWCVANVVKADSGEVVVNYDGWSTKYDNTFKLKSHKICPFRLASRGYTGQVRVPLRTIEFSLAQLAENRKKLEEVIDSGFGSLKTAHEVTQYLRGKLYLYVDFLLANEYKAPDKEIAPVVEFFTLAVKLVALWLSRLPDLLKPFVESQTSPKLILVDRNVALAACGFELLDMLRWFFCQCPRTLLFFSRYDVNTDKSNDDSTFTKQFNTVFEHGRDSRQTYEDLRKKIMADEPMVYGLFVSLFNVFCHVGGLSALTNILAADKLALKATAAGLVGYKLPFDVMAMLLAPFRSIKAIARDEVCKEIANMGRTAFFNRIQALDDKDIKDVNKEHIVGAMGLMRSFLRLAYDDEETSKAIQAHEMLISLKFLQSSALEKRLNGLADIKKMIDHVELPGAGSWFNVDYLVKWVVQHNILGEILDDSVHAELIRRTSYVFAFLARHGAVTIEMLELLWKCQQDKHEDLVRAVFDTIKDIVEYLSAPNISYLNLKLAAYPLEAYDEKLITFTKDFTLKAYIARSLREDSDLSNALNDTPPEVTGKIDRDPSGDVITPVGEALYGLPRLWALQQDESPIQPPLLDQATAAFKEIMASPEAAGYRHQYLHLCIQNVRKDRSVPQSLAMANSILAVIHANRVVHKTTVQEVINKLAKEYGLVEVMLNSLGLYEKKVMETVGKGVLRQENIGETVIVGKYKHSASLELRFRFVEYLRRFGGDEAKFGKENLTKLWNLFVDGCGSEYDTRQFLKWLSNDKDATPAQGPTAVFSADENLVLFDTIAKARAKLGNKLDLSYYKCFANFFKLINIAANSLDISKKGRVRVLKFASLIGVDAVWENVCLCSQEASRVKFCELLIEIYTSLDESLQDQKTKLMESFIDRCMQSIRVGKSEGEQNDLTIANVVKLLQQLFDMLDGKKYDEGDDPSLRKFEVVLVLKPGPDMKAVQADIDVLLGQVRRMAAITFHIPFNAVQLFTAARTLDPEDDDLKLRNIGWAAQINVQKLAGFSSGSIQDPKMYLAQNQTYINNLFVLLAKEGSPYVDAVWNLIATLPANQRMQADLETLNMPSSDSSSSDSWNTLLHSKSTHKLLYSLQIVERIIASKREHWLEEFCKKQGLGHLFSALLSLPTSSIKSPLPRKCFALLFKVLFTVQAAGYDFAVHIRDYEAMKEKLVERVLIVLESFVDHSLMSEAEKALKMAPKKAVKSDPAAPVPPVQNNKEKEEMAEEAGAFEHGFALIKGNENYFELLLKFCDFKRFLLKTLVLSANPKLQQVFSDVLANIYHLYKDKEYSSPMHAHVVLIPYMLQSAVSETLNRETKCQCFYQLLCTMIKESSAAELAKLPINFHELLTVLSDDVKNRSVKESKSTDTDEVTIGLLNLIDALLKRFPAEREFTGDSHGLVYEVLHHCLFEFPKSGNRQRTALSALPPKCKSQGARQAAFNLLATLACDTPKNLRQILEYLTPIHANAAWRTKRLSDWDVVPEISEKSTTGYVGIKNLGCICYMNSLLQQLYMIPSFRNDILSVVDPKKDAAGPDDNALFQTQCLFTALNESVKQFYNPKLLCHALKGWEGKSIDVFEQMDVDEFFSLFLDRMESSMKGTPQELSIKRHFGGIFANQLLCKDCPHSSVREEPFLALNLQVKNKRSLEQCLESFVDGEMLQGNNAYYCEKCDKKVTTLKRVCIKRLPRYMVCVLKRFDIDYDTMQKFKINDYCEFPMKLNMEPFTEEGLAKKDREKERAKARKEGQDLDEASIDAKAKAATYPPEYYEYKLTGSVLHIGTAEGGHYYSLIMDREKTWLPEKERWYEFNDTFVEPYDPADIRDDAFGAEEHLNTLEGALKSFGRMRNAYLLVYERVSPYDPPEEEDEEEKSRKAKLSSSKPPPATESNVMHNAIMVENIKYWHNKFMFHEDYLDFARKLCLTWNSGENILLKYPSKNLDYNLLGITSESLIQQHSFQAELKDLAIPAEERQLSAKLSAGEQSELDLKVYKYAVTLLLTTLVRARHRALVPDFVNICKAYQNKHFEASQWILQQFTSSKVVCEFLLECPEIEMRCLVVGILYCAMLQTYPRERAAIGEKTAATQRPVLVELANCLLQQLAGCRRYTIYFEQYLQMFARLAFLGEEMRGCLLRSGTLKRLLGFWGSLAETKWNVFTDVPFQENVAPELGLPSVVDEKFQSFFEEFFASKRLKAYQEAQAGYTFLFEAVALLIRGTAGEEKEKSPLALGPGLKLTADLDVKPILTDPKLLSDLIKDCRGSIAITSISQALVHFSWGNLDLKLAITKGLLRFISVSEWDNLRKAFFFLRALLRAKDPAQKAFVSATMSELLGTMELGNKVFNATYMSIKYLISLAKDSVLVLDWMHANSEKWMWTYNWLKDSSGPSYNPPLMQPYKSKEQNGNFADKYPDGLTSEEKKEWRGKIEVYEKALVRVQTGDVAELADEIGGYHTMYYSKILLGQTLELCDTKRMLWERTIVKRVLDEMIFLQFEGFSESYAEWVQVDGNRLTKEGIGSTGSRISLR